MVSSPRNKTRKAKREAFPEEDTAEKPWTKNPNYKRWFRRLTRFRRTAKADTSKQNMCVTHPSMCEEDLGIPRKLMPQFSSAADIRSFREFLRSKYGIGSKRTRKAAEDLKPSQEEIRRDRTDSVREEIRLNQLDPKVPIVISANNYVIDGHHRWAAFLMHSPKKLLPVLQIKASGKDVLGAAAAWGAEHQAY
jgi:hypothetical protein